MVDPVTIIGDLRINLAYPQYGIPHLGANIFQHEHQWSLSIFYPTAVHGYESMSLKINGRIISNHSDLTGCFFHK